MHKSAHQRFAMGIAAIVGFIFNVHIVTIVLILPIAGIVGIIPDYDIKMKIAHRGTTHTFTFIMISTVVLSFMIIIFEILIQVATKSVVLTGMEFQYESFTSIFEWEAFYIFFALFLAGCSHILLDIITPMGLDMRGGHVSGSVLSSSSVGNAIFSFLGWAMILIGVVGLFGVHYLHELTPNNFYLSIVLILTATTIGILLAIVIKRKPLPKQLYCGVYDGIYGPIEMCNFKPCISIDGNEICFDKKEESQSESDL